MIANLEGKVSEKALSTSLAGSSQSSDPKEGPFL
jgi:hypothetical protein